MATDTNTTRSGMNNFDDGGKLDTLHAHFERQAALRPAAVAASCAGHHLSYAQLNTKANQLAWFLRSQGAHESPHFF
jgi:non-ribosomal peptide synthetase component F